MNSPNNRRNHNFQILHFLVGHCHTVDGAYSLLCDLREERRQALGIAAASDLREELARKKLNARAASEAADIALEAKADLLEMDANREVADKCIAAARAELGFIEACMNKLEPHRKFGNLPLPEAHEAAQRGEWLGELCRRAENFLITHGTIPADEFNTMRMHPDFSETIFPRICQLQELCREPDGVNRLLAGIEPVNDADSLVHRLQSGGMLLLE